MLLPISPRNAVCHHYLAAGMYTVMVALFLPGVVLILGAGFVFGFWRGLLAVWAGGAVGQALAFLLARCAGCRRAAAAWVQQVRMQHGMQHGSWQPGRRSQE